MSSGWASVAISILSAGAIGVAAFVTVSERQSIDREKIGKLEKKLDEYERSAGKIDALIQRFDKFEDNDAADKRELRQDLREIRQAMARRGIIR